MLIRHKCLLSLFFYLLSATAFGLGENRLLVLGDSLSAGYRIEVSRGWVSLLQQQLNNAQLNIKVINGSISGNTTADGLARLPKLLKTFEPQYVIITLGANDGLRGYPIRILKRNLQALIDKSQQAGATVMIGQMKIPPNYGQRYTQQFEKSYSEISRQNDLVLLPFLLDHVATKPELMQNDGLHPKAEAQGIILDTIWPGIEQTIRALES